MRTILQWYQGGGPFIVPLLVVGLAGLVVLAERFSRIVLQTRINARPFVERVISLARANKIDEALALCAEHRSVIPDLGLVILRSRSDNEGDLLHVAEAAALTMVPKLTRRLAWLPVLATVAILLGVLGAVANLHDGLADVARGAVVGDVAGIPGAVIFSLRPLGVGVLTAIPLLAGHAWLQGEAQDLIGKLEEFSARLVNALIDRPDVRLGHRD